MEAYSLDLRGVSKTFPGVRALQGVDLNVRPGSVHALLGHNGSGKSTIIKCLAGVHSPDPGAQAWSFGEPLSLGDPDDAASKGLRFVHQDMGIFSELRVVDNIGFVTGYRRHRFGGIDWRRQDEHTQKILARFGFQIDPGRPLSEVSPPERAAVAIVRAVSDWPEERGLLVLDEPTAALPAREVDRLFELIRSITDGGASVLLVSHRLDEVMAIADEATVMRDGRVVWTGGLADVRLQQLVDLVAGPNATNADDGPGSAQRATPRPAPVGAARQGGPVLRLRNVSGRYLDGVDLDVADGEIVGVAGLLGSGRDELPYVIAGGWTQGVTGGFEVDGRDMGKMTLSRARAAGIQFVPADRANEGVFDGFSTAENVALAALPALRRGGVVTPASERKFARKWLSAVRADPEAASRPIDTLSGGNQQKALIARALSVGPKVLVLSEPTAGIDIGARSVIYDELRARVAGGLAVVIASSDTEDLVACCDRVIALRDGHIVREFRGDEITKSALAHAIEGAHQHV